MEKTCTVCSKDSSPYKCPKCSFLYCSVSCCKVHKATCSALVPTLDTLTDHEIDNKINTSTTDTTSPTSQSSPTSQLSSNTHKYNSLNDKISSSLRLQSFLTSSPYLSSHLPVLLARIERHDALSANLTSQLARDLDKKERIFEVLKEAIEIDPKVAELYQILLEENII